jgi:predicted metal-dependent peptidase
MFSYCETDYNLDRHLIAFLQDTPFFAELSRYIRKVPTKDIPTAGVTFDQQYDDITLYWNPDFFASLSDADVRGVLIHEFYHLIFQHISTRFKKPAKMWNVATDLAINSIIVSGENKSITLPKGGLIPGQFPIAPDDQPLTKEQKAAMPMASLIESFPHGEASEWYFDRLKQKAEQVQQQMQQSCPRHGNGQSQPQTGQGDPQNKSNKSDDGNQAENKKNKKKGTGEDQGNSQGAGDQHGDDNGHNHHDKNEAPCTCGEDWLDSMDDHSGWEQIPEELREKVKGQVANAVDKAVKHADSHANGWGYIPGHLREEIRKSVSSAVDWRNVLHQFVGSLERGNKTSSMKRINKRYPYIHPGKKRGYTAKLLIAVDQSGSVSNQMLSLFFGELATLTKRVSVTILPFDATVAEKDMVEWKKGTNPDIKRVRGGGTDFNAPTVFANDPKNRGRWDGMLVLTDGECSKPDPSRIKRGWVLGQGCTLHFTTDEITISLDPNPQKSGAWR